MKHKFRSFSTEYHLALAYRVVQNVPYFVFHSKVVFYSFFPCFSGGVDSRTGRFFLTLIWIQLDAILCSSG